DAAGDAPDVARPQLLLLAADCEAHSAAQQHADLVVRVRVLLDDGVWLQVDHRDQQPFRGAGADVDTGEDGVAGARRRAAGGEAGALGGGGEVGAHVWGGKEKAPPGGGGGGWGGGRAEGGAPGSV